jgi:hypothetical protein
MPGGKAIKPGDVVKAMNGKTIQIDNTDAEGRLILADALAYAQQTYQPNLVLDIATLTGIYSESILQLTKLKLFCFVCRCHQCCSWQFGGWSFHQFECPMASRSPVVFHHW